jgi:hypothetical protein
MTKPIASTDYHMLCAFFGTGVKGSRPNRPTEFVEVRSPRRYEVGRDAWGWHVMEVFETSGHREPAWVGGKTKADRLEAERIAAELTAAEAAR